MVASNQTGAVARPVPGAAWQGRVSDAAEISAALNRLWRGLPDADAAQPRASTLNLTVVVRSSAAARHAMNAVSRLSNLYPSRATILVANHDRPPADPGLAVDITLLEQAAARGRPAVRFECITVEVSARDEQQLASITSPLLVFDLPDFLWWNAGATGGELFDDLVAITDRLIVDTATVQDPGPELAKLSGLIQHEAGNLRLSDMVWARLEPWRHLITQFFDAPAARPALEAIDGVTIWYGTADPQKRSALSAGLLLAGWLGARLGWQAPGEMVPVRSTPGGWRVTLRAGGRGHRRETVLTLLPSFRPAAGSGPGRVELTASGVVAGTFQVERTDQLGLTATSEIAGSPPTSRGVFSPLRDDAVLLASELQVFGRDLIYEAALAMAATLAPAPTAAE